MWINEFASMMLLTTLTGGVCTGVGWLFMSVLRKNGMIRSGKTALSFIEILWLVPVVYLLLRSLNYGCQWRWGGYLFMPTPFLMAVSRGAVAVWAAGTAVGMFRYARDCRRLQQRLRKAAEHPDMRMQERFQTLCAEKGIRHVRLLRLDGLNSPVAAGVFRRAVILPEWDLQPEDAEMILRHELTHMKNRDVLRKQLACWIVILHWCNPLAWRYQKLVSFSCECVCDLTVCAELGSMKRYYYAIIRLQEQAADRFPAALALAEDDSILRQRMAYIKEAYKMGKNGIKKTAAAALTMTVMVLSMTGSVSAASLVVADAYTAVVHKTEVRILEPEDVQLPEIVEPTPQDEEVVFGEVETRQNADNDFSYNIAAEKKTVTAQLYLEEGTRLIVAADISPTGKKADIGLVQPDGTDCCITESGSVNHVFEIKTTGNYKFFIRNNNETAITAEGIYVIR